MEDLSFKFVCPQNIWTFYHFSDAELTFSSPPNFKLNNPRNIIIERHLRWTMDNMLRKRGKGKAKSSRESAWSRDNSAGTRAYRSITIVDVTYRFLAVKKKEKKTWIIYVSHKSRTFNQGNLLRGTDKKTIRREEISICLLVFSYQ